MTSTTSSPASAVTPDGVHVRVGQIWQDCDKRVGERRCEVVAVENGFAHLQRWAEHSGRQTSRVTRIAISRMRPTSTGWRLFRDAT